MCHAVCRAVVCEAVEAVGCLRGLLLLQCAAKVCGQCAERVAVPYEGVAFHRVHVDRYGVVARCHAVGRGYLKPYGTGEVDGVVGVCEVVVDGFFAFLACFDEVSHRHSLELHPIKTRAATKAAKHIAVNFFIELTLLRSAKL